MKTTSSIANVRPRNLIRRASVLVMASVVTVALAGIRPVCAQTNDHSSAQMAPAYPESPAFTDPGESWDVGPLEDDPSLAPAPEEQAAPEPAPPFEGFTSEAPGSLTQPWMQRPEGPFAQPFVNPSIPAPAAPAPAFGAGMPHGAFYGPNR